MFYYLENEKYYAVADTKGGELISLKDKIDNTEYLWGGSDEYWAGRSPHLFPIIGTLKDDKALMGNQYYSMKKHGIIRYRELEAAKVSKNAISFVSEACEQTKKNYPYNYKLVITHQLLEDGFTTTYEIINQGEEMMYCQMGGHVGVSCPICSNLSFEDYQIQFDQNMACNAYFQTSDAPLTKSDLHLLLSDESMLSLSHQMFQNGAVIIPNIKSHVLKLKTGLDRHYIKFYYEDFPNLALWTKGDKKAPYICLEPWHGLPALDSDTELFSQKPDILAIMPQEAKKLQYRLSTGID